ncbi:hypothetical protein BSKO_00197 [Bryopsis sp. KO-2023]|nr:hypothetical protein BSKO_00197 [Bryopsis sp. KO-2023]
MITGKSIGSTKGGSHTQRGGFGWPDDFQRQGDWRRVEASMATTQNPPEEPASMPTPCHSEAAPIAPPVPTTIQTISSVPAPIPLSGPPEFINSGTGSPTPDLTEEGMSANPPGSDVTSSSVSNWLTSLLNRDGVSGTDGNGKVMAGVPGGHFDANATATANAVTRTMSPVGYPGVSGASPGVSAGVGASTGVPVEERAPQSGSGEGVSRSPELDFTPIQFAVHNGQRAVSPMDVQLAGQQVVPDPGVLATTSGIPTMNEQVYFTGSVMERNVPEQVIQGRLPISIDAAGRQVVTDERTGQVHVLVQDLNQLKGSTFTPVKLENKGQLLGQHRGLHDMRGMQVGGVGGALLRTDHVLGPAHDFAPIQQQTPKTRWKPNSAQLTLLERHFNSGYTKPTPELFAAVKCAGEAKEAQVSVWLKNRLARSKRQGNKPQGMDHHPHESGSDNRNNADGSMGLATTGVKRRLEDLDEESFDDFTKLSAAVLGEVSSALGGMQANDVTALAVELCTAGKVCCYGVGREKLVMKSFVVRLRHLGLDAYMVGEIDTPVVTAGDIMLASAGPSFYNTVNAVCLAAIRAGTRVIAFTAHQTAPLPFADHVIRIPTFPIPSNVSKSAKLDSNSGGENPQKILQLGSAYEVTLWMVFECVALMIQKRRGVAENDMLAKHTNLE